MNVWIFNEYAASPRMAGSTRHYDCAQRLVRKGWRVTIFSGIHGRGPHAVAGERLGRHAYAETLHGVRFAWISAPAYRANDVRRLWSMVVYSVRAFGVARRLPGARGTEAPDVVVGSSVHLLAALVGWRTARRLGVPFVLELRDLWPQSLIEMGVLGRWHPFALGLRALESWLVRRATRVVVLSERTAEYLTSRGAPSESVVVVPNGVDLERSGAVTRAPEAGSVFRAVYLGAHGVANRLDVILDAARALQTAGVGDVRFIFVGGGNLKTDLASRAQELGLTNVEFRPSVAKEMVPAVLAEADALLLTEANNIYGSSNKLNDYLAAGRPIVFSTFAAHNVAAGCGIEVAPGDARALADSLVALKEMSAASRADMGACARRFAEMHRSWDLLADRFANVLEEAVALRKS